MVWDSLKKENKLVITNNGKPTAVMVGIEEGTDVEETLASIRQAEAMRLVNSLRLDAARQGISRLTLGEINEEIAEARRENGGH
jgi:antitoxin (DNA-binding transcriptional repressor) of toxin-antitoxin stability system